MKFLNQERSSNCARMALPFIKGAEALAPAMEKPGDPEGRAGIRQNGCLVRLRRRDQNKNGAVLRMRGELVHSW